MSKDELLELKQLQDNHAIEIIPADKGGNVVIWSDDDYFTEVTRQLSTPTYKAVSLEEINRVIEAIMKNAVDNNLSSKL
ncbi:hypothetical protein GJ496_007855, partial [Pomphorhynchus laevis]